MKQMTTVSPEGIHCRGRGLAGQRTGGGDSMRVMGANHTLWGAGIILSGSRAQAQGRQQWRGMILSGSRAQAQGRQQWRGIILSGSRAQAQGRQQWRGMILSGLRLRVDSSGGK